MNKKHVDRHDIPFYDKTILRHQEQDIINALLEKHKGEPVTDDLKKKIYEELMLEKHLGRISIPFKVEMKKDPKGCFPDAIEVILDTKV